jgi:hypothetical protein
MDTGTHIAFEIECYDFPCAALSPYAHLRLGTQARDDVVQDVSCAEGLAHFRFTLEAICDEAAGSVVWRGAYAHGPRTDRFIYLCWGAWGEGGWQHFRRAKAPLSGLDPALVQRAMRESQPIRARIRMTDAKGEPVAATLKAGQVVWSV